MHYGRKRSPYLTDLERCDAEIAQAEAYLRAGHSAEMEGALMGLHDWRCERKLIELEIES